MQVASVEPGFMNLAETLNVPDEQDILSEMDFVPILCTRWLRAKRFEHSALNHIQIGVAKTQ